jgi:hypothetical protein
LFWVWSFSLTVSIQLFKFQVSATSEAVFNLNARCATVFSLSDETDVHLMGQHFLVHPLKVNVCATYSSCFLNYVYSTSICKLTDSKSVISVKLCLLLWPNIALWKNVDVLFTLLYLIPIFVPCLLTWNSI